MALVESTTNVEQKRQYRHNWAKLILSTIISVALGVFTVVYTIQQDKLARISREQELNIARENRKQDLSIAEETAARDVREREKLRKQTVYDFYIDELSETIFSRHFNRSNVNHLMKIRIQTLNAIHQLDLNQKREVILFLYENGLIRTSSSNTVNLRGVDLKGVQFVRSASFRCDLNDLYLAEVLADNILFDGCQLQRSVFNGASLNGAKFFNSITSNSRYEGADMVQAVFNLTNKYGSNFASADLRNASFSSNFQKNNFTNTDLFGSDQTEKGMSGGNNIIINTRFSNGSFSAIDTKQLVMDGGAEIMVGKQAGEETIVFVLFSLQNCNGSSKYWYSMNLNSKLYIVNKSYTNGSIQGIRGNCFFKFIKTFDAYQYIYVQQYSTFIDSSEAWYNISASLMCRSTEPDDEAYVILNFNNKDHLFYTRFSVKISKSLFVYNSNTFCLFQYRRKRTHPSSNTI